MAAMSILHGVLLGVLVAMLLMRVLDGIANHSRRFTTRDLLFVMTVAAVMMASVAIFTNHIWLRR
jgi:hypothetical protein